MPVPLTLKVFKGEDLLVAKDFDRDIIKIGRLSSAHLCLDDEKVSRIHSVIEVGADGALSIIDMGSVEGTWVNGKRVNKGTLAFGDEIKVGNTTIKVENVAQVMAANLQSAAASMEAATAVAHVDPALLGAIAQPNAPVAAPPPPPAAAYLEGRDVSATVPLAVAPVIAQQAPVQYAHTGAAPVAPRAPVEYAPAAPSAAPVVQAYAETTQPVQEEQIVQRPHRSLRKKGSGPLGLELRIMWGDDQMVAEHFLRPGVPGRYTVGTASNVNFNMGDAKLGGPTFEVARADKQGYVVRFTNKMKGEHWKKGEAQDLTLAIESGKASRDGDAYALSIGNDDFVSIDLGGVRLEACLQPMPKPVFAPFSDSVDFTFLNILLLLLFLGAVSVITFANIMTEGDLYADDLNSNQARIAKLIIKPPETEKKNPLLERLAKQKEKRAGEMAAKHRKEEGQAGKKDAPKKNARMAPKGDPSNKDQARMLTQKIFGSEKGGISSIFGKNSLGGELKAGMGNLFGATAGDAGGFGGLGLRGSGAGGGGVGDTIGIGGIGTKGRGGGMGKYGEGVGLGMGGKKGVDIGITQSDPIVMGSLDKELIRQVIRRNIGQIRYCYESQLTRFPKLNGKVAIKFVITAAGTVASSSVAQSTAGNAELETCVAGRVRTWQFPKPKGGGVVVVTYPFIFKQAGQ